MTLATTALLTVVAILAACVVALLLERSRRARGQRDLRASEERFRLMAEHAPVMMWTARPDTTLDYFNGTCMEFTGLPLEALLGEGWLDAVHPEDVAYCIGTYVPAFEALRPFLMEYRVRRADGVYRWLLDSGVPRFEADGRLAGYIGCSIDITERREAERVIRESRTALEASHREIQRLAGRLIQAQDAERARVARDLHDDVSQQLAGLSIALSGFRHRLDALPAGEDLQADLRALHQRTASLAQNVRHLSHDLHPTVLRHAGLVAALTSYCAELERSHGTVLACSAEGDLASLAPETALCLYRIAQEALRNVVAHAGASRAHVRLLRAADRTEMTIADDGNGFDLARSLERGSSGLGLVSIRERARLAGGTVSIAAEPGQGTSVCVRIPEGALLKAGAAPRAEDRQRAYSLPL
jgi:two-component system sensor histidine kinase UhpB